MQNGPFQLVKRPVSAFNMGQIATRNGMYWQRVGFQLLTKTERNSKSNEISLLSFALSSVQAQTVYSRRNITFG